MDIPSKYPCLGEDEEGAEEEKENEDDSTVISVTYNPSYKKWRVDERRKRKKGLKGDPRYKYSMEYDRKKEDGKGIWGLPMPRSLRETELPSNIVQTLFQKEMGFAHSTYTEKLDSHRIRQMIANRAPQDSNSVEIRTGSRLSHSTKKGRGRPSNKSKAKETGNKWIRTVIPSNGGKHQIDFYGYHMIVKEPRINTRRFYSLNNFVVGNSQFQLEYEIVDKDQSRFKWRDYEVWYVDPVHQRMTSDGNILKIPCTLFVLEDRKLVLYDYYKGTKLQEFPLLLPNAPAHYSEVSVDNEEDYPVCVYAKKPEVIKTNPTMVFEILILRYPPLKAVYRILVPKTSIFSVFNDFSIGKGQLLMAKGNSVESYDFADMISQNLSPSRNKNETMATVHLRYRCAMLFKVQSHSGFSDQVESLWPPCIVIKTKVAQKLKPLDDLEGQIHTIEASDDDDVIWHFDELQPLVIVNKLGYGIDVLLVDRKERQAQTVFSTIDLDFAQGNNHLSKNQSQLKRINTEDSSDTKKTLRPKRKTNYTDGDIPEALYQFVYNECLNLLAICRVSEDGFLHAILLDCKIPAKPCDLEDGDVVPAPTLPIFKRLQPVKLTKPKGVKDLRCESISMKLTPSCLLVKLRLHDALLNSATYFDELYTARLLEENTLE